MDWRIKALLFRAFGGHRFSRAVHYWVQRNVTRSLPRPASGYPRYVADTIRHVQAFRLGGSISDKTHLEIGAGWDLFNNVVLYACGVGQQIVVDLYPHLRPELVDDVIKNLPRFQTPDFIRLPAKQVSPAPHDVLRESYGIRYLAPLDARSIPFRSGHIELVSTTNTLEHIPFPVLRDIVLELYRVCAHGAILSMQVDYTDHYSHADSAITPYNFLRFGESEWAAFNPPAFFQNRRRHIEYRSLFVECGFRVLFEEFTRPSNWMAQLGAVRLHEQFTEYPPEELAITSGHFILTRA